MLRADRATQLLDIAERLVLKDGFAAFTMERLAKEAGVAKTVVYSHFNNASGMAVALLKRRWSDIDEASGFKWRDAGPLEAELRALAQAYISVSPQRMVLRRLLTELERDPVAGRLILRRQERRREALAKRLMTAHGFSERAAELAALLALALLTATGDFAAAGKRSEREMIEVFLLAVSNLISVL
jgi:AcrR family transcriptional regulator